MATDQLQELRFLLFLTRTQAISMATEDYKMQFKSSLSAVVINELKPILKRFSDEPLFTSHINDQDNN